MDARFGTVLADLIAARDISQREFARQSGYPQPNLVKVIQGERPPPIAHIPTWADCLALDEPERDELMALALEAHGMAPAAETIRRLRQRLTEGENKSGS